MRNSVTVVRRHMSSRFFIELANNFFDNYWRDAKMKADEQEPNNREEVGMGLNSNHHGQSDCLYHAVFVAAEDDEDKPEGITQIYQDKLEALKLMKKYKTGRMKTFHTREEAEDYARHGEEKEKCPAIIVTCANDEKPSNFKGPKPQELVAFRKLIESGDLEAVKNVAWENPRYLISSGDTPAILQEGSRYNALHIIAAKSTHMWQMCELILNTVGNPEYIKLLYGEEECKSYVDRAEILLDLYLNTPDKGLNETPLHFAAKYGLKDIVRVLVSYSQCVKNLRNKYGQTPLEVVCSRKCQDDEALKRDIRLLLEDQYYVPVLRSEDNTLQPTIGQPFSPTSPPKSQMMIDPISPRVEVRAFAGPMTKPQALEFRRKWKTPPRVSLNFSQRKDTSLNDSLESFSFRQADSSMRLQDTEKGLERVGRDLAEEYHVSWKEFWPFLNDFADLRCNEGLALIEKYLEKRFKDVSGKEEKSSDICRKKDYFDEMSKLCDKLESWTLGHEDNSSDSDADEKYYTPPTSPMFSLTNSSQDSDNDDEMYLADEGSDIFIEGKVPSKNDFAVYYAIPACINKDLYPCIYRWRHQMQLIIDSENLDCSSNFSSVRRKILATPEKSRYSNFGCSNKTAHA